MVSIFETIMLLCFGFSWPFNLMKSIRAKSVKGISLPFLALIEIGYISGITAKIIGHNVNYVLFFYFLNLLVVGANIAVYFRNKKLEADTVR